VQVLAGLGGALVALALVPACLSRRRRLVVALVGCVVLTVAGVVSRGSASCWGTAGGVALLGIGWASWLWQLRVAFDLGRREKDNLPPLVRLRRPGTVPYNPIFNMRYLRLMLRDPRSLVWLHDSSFDFDRVWDNTARLLRRGVRRG
jgi:hypothetical protein